MIPWKQKTQQFIHSGYSYTAFQVHYYSEAPLTQHWDASKFHAKAPRATASEGLAQGPYVVVNVTTSSFIILH